MLVLFNLLQNDSRQVMLPQIASEMGQVLICITHEVSQNRMVNRVGLSSLHDIILLLELQLRCVYLKLLHTFPKSRVLVVNPGHADHLGIKHTDKFLEFIG